MSFNIKDGKLNYYCYEPGETSITIPDTVRSIESFALNNQSKLVSIHIPAGVTEIRYHSFYECPNLKRIQVSKRNLFFTDIDGVLYDKSKHTLLCCPSGLESIHIPANVTNMRESDAFAGCQHLKEITVDKRNRKYTVLNGVLYEHNGVKLTKLIRCPVDIRELHIPESVTEIFPHAFEYSTQLEKITLPKHVTKIESYTFQYCHHLKQVPLHSGIEYIGESAFRDCNSLKEIILPMGIKAIRSYAFSSCQNLEKLVIPESVKSASCIVSHCPNLCSVICHGINIPVPNKYLGAVIYMIAEKDLTLKFSPSIKYPILYQMFLRNQDDRKIEQYIQENFTEIMTGLILDNQLETVQNYVRAFRKCLTVQLLDELIRLAIDEQKYEIQIFLTNLKYQRNDFSPKDWSL